MKDIRQVCIYLPAVKSKYFVSDTGQLFKRVHGVGHNGSVRVLLEPSERGGPELRKAVTGVYKDTLKHIRMSDKMFAPLPRTNGIYVVLADGFLLKRVKGRKHRTCPQGRIMYILFCNDETTWELQAGRVTAACFVGPLGDLHVHHKDGDAHNNRADNLELIHPSEHASLENELRKFNDQ